MSDKTKKTGPFNSLREFMDAIEASGLKKAVRKVLHQWIRIVYWIRFQMR